MVALTPMNLTLLMGMRAISGNEETILMRLTTPASRELPRSLPSPRRWTSSIMTRET